MAKRKAPRRKPAPTAKPSREQMAEIVRGKHAHIARAVHRLLKEKGLRGVSLHSLRFRVAPEAMTGSGCGPDCPPGDCVLDSSNGVVRWVCLSRESGT